MVLSLARKVDLGRKIKGVNVQHAQQTNLAFKSGMAGLYYTDVYCAARTSGIKHFLYLCFLNILCFPIFYTDKE